MEVATKVVLIIGLIGVGLTLLINLYVVFGMHRSDSSFFSQLWWSRWFPIYIAMGSAAFVAGVLRFTMR